MRVSIRLEQRSLSDFLDYLTASNRHSERCVVEAIISGRADLVSRAMLVYLKHDEDGYLTPANGEERDAIYRELERGADDER